MILPRTVFRPALLRRTAIGAAALAAAPWCFAAGGWLPAGELHDSDVLAMQVVATPPALEAPAVAGVQREPAAAAEDWGPLPPSTTPRAAVREELRLARAQQRLAQPGEIAEPDAVLQAREEHIVAMTEQILAEHRLANAALVAWWRTRDADLLIAEGYVNADAGGDVPAPDGEADPEAQAMKPEDEPAAGMPAMKPEDEPAPADDTAPEAEAVPPTRT